MEVILYVPLHPPRAWLPLHSVFYLNSCESTAQEVHVRELWSHLGFAGFKYNQCGLVKITNQALFFWCFLSGKREIRYSARGPINQLITNCHLAFDNLLTFNSQIKRRAEYPFECLKLHIRADVMWVFTQAFGYIIWACQAGAGPSDDFMVSWQSVSTFEVFSGKLYVCLKRESWAQRERERPTRARSENIPLIDEHNPNAFL